jgi:phage tail-like protein
VPEVDSVDWFAHDFGECPDDRVSPQAPVHPKGAWVRTASELPFHPGLLQCPRAPNRSGLFTALIQRGDRRVRTLRGRFLHARVELYGNQRSTPEVAALRAYSSRFSYAEHYLPELYREDCFGPEADDRIGEETDHSTPADFLERFLDNFEGILTPLEDRIASAYLLTDPSSTPEDALDWLGSWIGMAFDPAFPTERRREMLRQAPQLYREHGTLPGLKRALEIATGGAVTGGEIVVLEDFRLRRTFATILGADFSEEDDPLLPGLSVSGNSFVGDTLFLGDEHQQEFMAVYSADLQKLASEEQAIAGLYDRLAHRVTVLVHQEVEPQDLNLIRRVVERETPAHVQAQVLSATWPFLVGIASLVGIDSYLGEKPPQRPVRVGTSLIGVRDLLLHPASLDPRLEGGSYPGAEDLGGELFTIDMGDGS